MRLLFVLLFAAPIYAQSAAELLQGIAKTYRGLRSVQIEASRSDGVVFGTQIMNTTTQYQYAEKAPGKLFIEVKREGANALLVSNGDETWRGSADKKAWAHQSIAMMDTDDETGDKEDKKDLRSRVAAFLFARYTAFARFADSATIVKQETLNKAECTVVRVMIKKEQHDLWIDRKRFVVLQHKEKSKLEMNGRTGDFDTTLKFKRVELNQEIADSVFAFLPPKAWKETEMLILPGEERVMLVDTKAANFELKVLDGEAMSLAANKGKVVVLDFWATWCPPCRKEMPTLNKLAGEYADKGVAFYGISAEEAGTVRGFVKKNSYTMPMVVDVKRDVSRRYGITAIPTLFIINREGVIKQHFIGDRNEATLRQAIEAVLR